MSYYSYSFQFRKTSPIRSAATNAVAATAATAAATPTPTPKTPEGPEEISLHQLFLQYNFPVTLLPPTKLQEKICSSKQNYPNAIFLFRKFLDAEAATDLLKFHKLPSEFKDLTDAPKEPPQEPLADLALAAIPPFEKTQPAITLQDSLFLCKNPQKISNRIYYLTAMQDSIETNVTDSVDKTHVLLQNTIDIYNLINSNPGFVKNYPQFASVSYVKAYNILWDIGQNRHELFLGCNYALVCKAIFCLRYFIHLYRKLMW